MICYAKPRLIETFYILYIHTLELRVKLEIVGIHKEPDSLTNDYEESRHSKLKM
jgi:hypothetical protein